MFNMLKHVPTNIVCVCVRERERETAHSGERKKGFERRKMKEKKPTERTTLLQSGFEPKDSVSQAEHAIR